MLYNIILNAVREFPKNANFHSDGARRVLAEKITTKIKKEFKMKLSNQAMGAIMMALQKSLLEQSDIVPVLKSFEFKFQKEGNEDLLMVSNPPSFKLENDTATANAEVTSAVGSD